MLRNRARRRRRQCSPRESGSVPTILLQSFSVPSGALVLCDAVLSAGGVKQVRKEGKRSPPVSKQVPVNGPQAVAAGRKAR